MPPTEEKPVPLPECKALIERLAASVELRRAARLRAFLLYVCDQTLHHGGAGLHEQEIGAAVFGRPPSYDTGIDNIVRVNATELRKRLEHYFADEGAQEQVILEIQRGSYAPVFRRRASPTPPPHPAEPQNAAHSGETQSATNGQSPNGQSPDTRTPPPEPAATPFQPPAKLPSPRLWQTASALLLLLSGALAWQNYQLTLEAQPWKRSPAVRALWGNFFDSPVTGPDKSTDKTDILLADTSFALAEDMLQRTIPLTDYLNYNYKRLPSELNLPQPQQRDLHLVLERNNGSIADFRVAQQILALDSSRLNLAFARQYTPTPPNTTAWSSSAPGSPTLGSPSSPPSSTSTSSTTPRPSGPTSSIAPPNKASSPPTPPPKPTTPQAPATPSSPTCPTSAARAASC